MQLTDPAFRKVASLFEQASGIRLRDDKRHLVAGRLARRVLELGLPSLDDYVLRHLAADAAECRLVVDALTTNETYFFREPRHIEHLLQIAQALRPPARLRVWSAAASSGEEAYTIAIALAEQAPQLRWEVVGTDLSTRMVETARRALYPMDRGRHIPPALLKRWCLKGQGEYAGQFLVERALREKVTFECGNLLEPRAGLGRFDVVFLRNVLIYFDAPAKQRIVHNVLAHLAPGGVLYTGLAETLQGLELPLVAEAPSIYRLQPGS